MPDTDHEKTPTVLVIVRWKPNDWTGEWDYDGVAAVVHSHAIAEAFTTAAPGRYTVIEKVLV